MKYSPWGHPIAKVQHVSYKEVLGRSYEFEPAVPSFNFFSRDVKTAINFRADSLIDASKPFKPGVKDDLRVFRSQTHYELTLNAISSIATELRTQLRGLTGFDPEDATSDSAITILEQNQDSTRLKVINFLAAEYDIIRKFTIQRVVRPLWFINSFESRDLPITPLHNAVWSAFRDYVITEISIHGGVNRLVDFYDLSDPVDTNAGSPTFEAGPGAKLEPLAKWDRPYSRVNSREPLRRLNRHNSLSAPESIYSWYSRLAELYGLDDPSASIAVGANRRFGPSRKASVIWQVGNDDVVAAKEVSNLPRIREVYMAAYHYNLLLSPLLRVMKAGMRGVSGWWHDEEALTARLRELKNYKYIIEVDVSALDKNMSIRHRTLIIRGMAQAYPQSVPLASLIMALQHQLLPYYIPDPLNVDPDENAGLILYPKEPGVGLYSGIKLTSVIDSYFVMFATMLTLVQAGVITVDDVRTGHWRSRLMILNLGDDVLLAFRDRKAAISALKHIGSSFAEMGVEAKVGLGSRFLMKHHLPGIQGPVLARILQQTLSNEHVRDGELFVLGYLARTQGWSEFCTALLDQTATDREGNGIIRKYIDSIVSLMAALPMGDLFQRGLTKDSSYHKRFISEIGSHLSDANNDTALRFLMELLARERFSTTGLELKRAMEGKLQRFLNVAIARERLLFTHAVKVSGLPIK